MAKSKMKTVSLKKMAERNNKGAKVKPTVPSAPPLKAIAKKQTKAQILVAIAEQTGLSTRQVKEVFIVAGQLAKCHLMAKGSGEFMVPEIAIKIVRKTKPATKAREGRNPITGEALMIAAKPKRDVIRVRPLKGLKEVLL